MNIWMNKLYFKTHIYHAANFNTYLVDTHGENDSAFISFVIADQSARVWQTSITTTTAELF